MKKRATKAIALAVIAAAVILTFLPSLRNGFTGWDDPGYVTENPLIRDVSPSGVARIFSRPYQVNYQPLTLLSYAVNRSLSGLDPFWFHLTDLCLHLGNCLLLFGLVILLGGSTPAALVVSLLFGLHPLHVETVAWVSGRKDALCGIFFLSSLIAYTLFLRSGKPRHYLAAFLLFTLALFSKTLAVALPLIFILVDYLKGERVRARLVPKIPFFLLALVFAVIALHTQAAAVRHEGDLGVFVKLRIAGYAVMFYIAKLIAPVKLACLYPYLKVTNGAVPAAYTWASLAFAGLAAAVLVSLRYTKKIFFGFGFFLLALAPVLQFVPLGASIVADRYTYVSSIGIFLIAGAAIDWLMRKAGGRLFPRAVLAAILAVIIASLASLSAARIPVWNNDRALWDDVIAKYGEEYVPIAYFNRGMAYWHEGHAREALRDLKRSLALYYGWLGEELSSGAALPFNELAKRFSDINRNREALTIFRKLAEDDPRDADAALDLCNVYGRIGDYRSAIAAGEKAVALAPGSGLAHFNLALAYYYDKQYEPARKELKAAKETGVSVPPDIEAELENPKGGMK